MPTPPIRSGVRWHTFAIAALTIGLLWLFFRGQDLRAIGRAIAQAHWGLIAIACLSVFVTYALRAWRWLSLLQPLGQARFRPAFRTTVIGFMATFLLPLRLGEVLRPYLLARHEGFSPAATLATILVERVLDLATVLLLFAGALPFAGVDVGRQVRVWSVVIAVLTVAGLAILFVLAGHPERLGRLAGRLTTWLPAKLGGAAEHLVRTFAEGLKIMRSPAHLATAIVWSVPVWVSIGFTVWLTSQAFGLTFSFLGSFLVVGLLTIGVAVPTPGGAGGFHVSYKAAVTQFFGANPEVAVAAATVLHLVSFVPITILGLVYMWQDGLSLGRLKDMTSNDQVRS